MSIVCQWLHEQLSTLPLVKYPFSKENLPKNDIYFIYEEGENWGHGGEQPRIVRIGTHKKGNFRSRISDHFLPNEVAKMNFDMNKPAPKDRSIFRKNIGRVLLYQNQDPYLEVWNKEYTERYIRNSIKHLRDIPKEIQLEQQITALIRTKFSFRYIILDSNTKMMGSKGLESLLIGTVSHCGLCRPSPSWLGNFSPVEKIKKSGLWLYQLLDSLSISSANYKTIEDGIERTRLWHNSN